MRSIGITSAAVVGVFAMVGIGLGISGFLTISTVKSQFADGGENLFGSLAVALIFLQNIYTTFLLGSLVAATGGMLAGITGSDRVSATVGGGIGTFVGFYVMAILAFVLMLLSLGGDAGGGDVGGLGNFIVPLLGAGVPATVVGTSTTYLTARFA